MLENWDTDQGNVKVQPLTGWQTVRIAMTGLVRLEHLPHREAEKTGERGHVQLAMTEQQLRELAQDLQKTADALAAQPRGTRQ